MVFTLIISLVITQRLVELIIARRNEISMKTKGAIEFFPEHYKYIVLIHISFFLSLLLEVSFFNKQLSTIWPAILALFLVTQAIRIWVLFSLRNYWNTKIIVLPGANIVMRGPYKFVRHPNYIIVCLEIILIPIMFQAYWTAIVFTILNAWVLSIRIPLEERALSEANTKYDEYIEHKNRFSPTFNKFTE
ncbi:hypothetical protein BC6307_10320 [Sutcliffiella cohnii]|uniref:Isoprenylcysteine carboxyl methyltransferase n=1 Tax=Sutcliffiella cohnii TaxID=33932 RepID=A0A223KQF8_9BACI|nr:isoprenylcysteine carboxylmethyltransferase family protein [Sutcliffiella cohnii]AST91646.1 hypothetical protein BC6307_10320 [Sutcliffiella cohnii]